ncbi:Putative phosphofructokinase PfkB [Thalassovita gelatinovora]|uniref:Phosphofructokinase n=1 Tax=Thalassovita gelatinovora TaxID=53501 RepID=A0A0P1F8L1_THAGE|nr:hexose kinase [Thalassovita gelatinovora]QIZ80357.1 hexose kinase [Thalassovita gelatinovora]CUH64301.1 Putative phosphofructokinase PfkB [Thalassovita gelatinovora]SEQ93631.1 6-phosphofructokinase 2 [Thalassovita gelatinovora]
MRDILTITLNPAVDMSTTTDRVSAGPKLRCDAPRTDPGGGGINVSRAVLTLGGHSRALVALGGPRGETLLSLLHDEGIAVLPFAAPGDTRLSLAVTDRTTKEQYRFVLPGPAWGKKRLNGLLQLAARTTPADGYVVLSGSQPPGAIDHFPALLAEALTPRNAHLIADISGPALQTLCDGTGPPVAALRMDRDESERIAGQPLPTVADSAAFAQSLLRRGVADLVVAGRGADGSVLAMTGDSFHAAPPPVPVVSKIGAGDSFVGAFTLALARGLSPQEALRHGTAAASAAVMTEATELCRRADADRLLGQCALHRLPDGSG